MMKRKTVQLSLSNILVISFFLILVTTDVSAQHMHDDHPLPEGASIGEVHFNVSCDEAVKEDFNYALGMMHHMMYVSARETFEKVIETDPGCAMGYWGVATSLFQPLWGTRPSDEDLQRGWENINRALDLVESDRESLLVQSTADFFLDPDE